MTTTPTAVALDVAPAAEAPEDDFDKYDEDAAPVAGLYAHSAVATTIPGFASIGEEAREF